MKNWQSALVAPETSVQETMETLSALQIALVVDSEHRLLGTVTDGDVRRALLRGVTLQDAVGKIMNTAPTTARLGEDRDTILATMKRLHIHHIPTIDDCGRVLGVELLDTLIETQERDNWVVLMAGGLGTRLRPLTDDCPKPLLRIGTKPILETIIDSFVADGFNRFYIAVNYKAEMIEDHFGDGSRWGAQIRYLREDRKMGTAGALSLIPDRPNQSLLVMNGDLLTKVNFGQLLNFHLEHEAQGTMCVREYDFQVPYGVVTVDNHRISALEEKPVHRFFVNAGIYVLEPTALDLIPENMPFDMTSLFETLMAQRKETTAYPIREYWLDIGHMDDFERASGEYSREFE